MLPLVIEKQKQKKFIIMNSLFFMFFMGLFTTVDFLNMSYYRMRIEYSLGLVIANILLNLIMALLSTLMLTFTSAQFDLSGKESRANNLSFFAVMFGILTYGCTPCVVSFFAAIGITFSVAILPWAGFPYKLISLAILIAGFVFIIFRIKKTTCTINISPK